MQPGDILDGYTILRLIGRGGYGEVWLCRSNAVGDLRALKFVAAAGHNLLEKEFAAIGSYRHAATRLRSPNLMPVEHVGRTAAGLYYVMPLADGTGGNDPTAPGWRPLTLATRIIEQTRQVAWFTCQEITELMRPVLEALQTLADAGLVHRDVKPDNILFFGGQPCLADIGLLDEDTATLTRRGTPGYVTPSWYVGGHPDMYGAAATLYTLLTGNPPDRMGRGAFTAPPQGLAFLTPLETAARKRLHQVIRRATDERGPERYPNFLVLASALADEPQRTSRHSRKAWVALVLVLGAAAALSLRVSVFSKKPVQSVPRPAKEAQAKETLPELTEEQLVDYRALAGMIEGYIGSKEYASALASVEDLLSTYPQARTQPVYSIARAMALKGLGRIDEAKDELRKDVNLSPKIPPLAARKDLWEELGELGEAEHDLSRILKKYGPNTFILFLGADVRAKRGDFPGIEADRQEALAMGPDDPERRRLVKAMWTPLETKFPGYADYLRPSKAKPSQDAPPRDDADATLEDSTTGELPTFNWLWSYVPPWVFEEHLITDSKIHNEEADKARELKIKAITSAYLSGQNLQSLNLLDEILNSQPVYSNQPSISLLRAVLLKRLDRLPEMETELHKPCHSELTWTVLGERIYLWDLLERWNDAEKFLTRIVEHPPSGAAAFKDHAFEVLKYRATMRARLGNFAGVAEDKALACTILGVTSAAAPPSGSGTGTTQAPGKGESADIVDYKSTRCRADIDNAWRVLEKEFPAYADFLRTHPAKTPAKK